MRKPKKSTIFRFVYIAATIIVLLIIAMTNEDFRDLPEVIAGLNYLWLLGGAGCIVIYWLTDGWLLGDITSYMSEKKLPFKKSLKIGMIGLYYCALTPSATGGQPVQVMHMSREKIPVGTGTCIVLIKFIAYALTTITYYLIALAFLNGFYMEHYPAMYWLSLAGFLIMCGMIFLVIFTIVKKDGMINFGKKIIGLFSTKIKVIKDPDEAIENFTKVIEDYAQAGRYIIKHKRRALGSYGISMLNFFFYFALTYFIYKSFNMDEETFPMIMMLQSLLYSAINYFPTPGGAGMSESGFYVIFSAFFPSNLAFAAMLIWRVFTYYLILVVGTLIVIFDEAFNIKRSSGQIPIETLTETESNSGQPPKTKE
ncbi:MAG: flippase-like domain-containing protein [Christensenellaceae bacterium]|nr:flippase-like domain-containing protein [Christensenellaceae bacterium]